MRNNSQRNHNSQRVELSLEDTAQIKARGLAAQARSGLGGYNPYDAEPAVKNEQRKPKDLRKLSEWIRLQRQVQALKKDKP